MKILSVQGSFTLVPDAYPLISTYLPLESNGLTTYPGLPGTALAVEIRLAKRTQAARRTFSSWIALSPFGPCGVKKMESFPLRAAAVLAV